MASLNERLSQALTELPEALQAWASALTLADNFTAQLSPQQAAEGCQLLAQAGCNSQPAPVAELMQALLPIARAYANPPVSDYPVGAWLEGASGALYVGANQEFAGLALNHSIHAEQAGVSHAWQSGERGIRHLAVTAPPCGHCRQFLNELDSRAELQVSLPGLDDQPLSALLPDSFGPSNLGVERGLMAERDQAELWVASSDQLISLAAEQAALSYAPYTRAQSAVALELEDGAQVFGRYAENVAFNPSLPPMQAALLSLRWLKSPAKITRAVLVERADCPISLRQESEQVLATESDISLEHWKAEPKIT